MHSDVRDIKRLMQTVLHQEYQLSVRMDKFIILPVFLVCNRKTFLNEGCASNATF